MRELPEPGVWDAGDTDGYTRDQVLAIQKQAYEDGLREASQACGNLYETRRQQIESDYDRGYLDGIEHAEIHIESLTEDPLKEPQ